jgi:lysophospholipase L1-like esterase
MSFAFIFKSDHSYFTTRGRNGGYNVKKNIMLWRFKYLGFDASTFVPGRTDYGRFPEDVRWTGVLQNLLGEGYKVIEEGHCGRTTLWDDPIECYKNGKTYLYPCLDSQRPLDLVIIMLGTNDMKRRFSLGPFDIAASVGELVKVVQTVGCGRGANAPEVLLVSPLAVGENIYDSPFCDMFEGNVAIEKAKLLPKYYKAIAGQYGCHFLNAADVASPSHIDAIHFEPEGHCKFAEAVAAKVKEILG